MLTAVLVMLCQLLFSCSSSSSTHPCSPLPPPSSFCPLSMSAHARENLSSWALCRSFDAFAEGIFRNVARARYTSGPREGQPCALKWSSNSRCEAIKRRLVCVRADMHCLLACESVQVQERQRV